MKRTYRKPELKVRRLELGVFGDYNDDPRGVTLPTPVSVIAALDLRME